MAKRNSRKWLSDQHERHIAQLFGGKQSKSSGAAVHDAGDVRVINPPLLIECKLTGNPGVIVSKPLPVFVRQLEKIALEAWEEGKEPVLALRYYFPDSVLAGQDGWVDLGVMLATDLAYHREIHVEHER